MNCRIGPTGRGMDQVNPRSFTIEEPHRQPPGPMRWEYPCNVCTCPLSPSTSFVRRLPVSVGKAAVKRPAAKHWAQKGGRKPHLRANLSARSASVGVLVPTFSGKPTSRSCVRKGRVRCLKPSSLQAGGALGGGARGRVVLARQLGTLEVVPGLPQEEVARGGVGLGNRWEMYLCNAPMYLCTADVFFLSMYLCTNVFVYVLTYTDTTYVSMYLFIF